MNKIAKGLLAVAMVASVGAANEMIYETGLGAAVNTGGYQYMFSHGGTTYTCNGEAFTSDDKSPADECTKITFNVVKEEDADGNLWGFGAWGFNFNDDGEDEPTGYDASSYNGICAEFTSNKPLFFKLKGEGWTAEDIEGHAVKTKAGDGSEQCFEWSKFKQPSWEQADQKYTFDPSKVAQFHVFAHSDGGIGEYTIEFKSISFMGGSAIANLSSKSSLNFSLAGKKLSFATAQNLNVQVFDLQGRQVLSGVVSSKKSTLSLNNLSQGSYIVRASNGDMNIQKKISLVD
jgi:hypothetical protein